MWYYAILKPCDLVDACISWEQTIPVLDRLREGVRGRRNLVRAKAKGLDLAAVKVNGINGASEAQSVKANGANGVHA